VLLRAVYSKSGQWGKSDRVRLAAMASATTASALLYDHRLQ
jgi:hypothetical protein